jgi:hypothetical protein
MIEVREVKEKEIIIVEQYISVFYKGIKVGRIKIEETINRFIITSFSINDDKINISNLYKDTEDILETYGLVLLKARKEIINFFEGVLDVH